MLVTIATPTYNRAHLLPRLYKSLCQQINSGFEWIIVDDGSNDDTEQVVAKFISSSRFNIKYIKQKNEGKHIAVNRAVKEAKGELFFIADSDDWLLDTAVADVVAIFHSVENDDSFGGVCGLDSYSDGNIVGSGLAAEIIDATPQEIRSKYGVTGDLKEVFRTDVIRQYPFPEFKEEKFCPEVLVWNRIGLKYILRYFNKPIYGVEYQLDGISSGITKARMKSPLASMLTYSEWFDQSKVFTSKVRMAINFWRFAFCAPRKNRIRISSWGNLLLPIGLFYYLKDIKSIR